MEKALLTDKLAQEDKLPEHRDDELHMIVKDDEILDRNLPLVKNWMKFYHDRENDACKDALRKTSDDHPEWAAAEIVHYVRRQKPPHKKDELGFSLSQNLSPYIARWLAYDNPTRRGRFKFSLMGKTRAKKVITGFHCKSCCCQPEPETRSAGVFRRRPTPPHCKTCECPAHSARA